MIYRLCLICFCLSLTAAAYGQETPSVTAEDYRRAQTFLSSHTAPLIFRANVQPKWIDEDRFIYRNTIPEGHEFLRVDAGTATRSRAFDHTRLAAAISAAADTSIDAFHLPFATSGMSDDGKSVRFRLNGTKLICDLEVYTCSGDTSTRAEMTRNARVSPDGRHAAFIRDHNLWLKNLDSGEETQLTTDGIEHFGYGTNNAGWIRSDRPVLLWSPDSKKIATFQHDARGVGDMYLVSTKVGHSELQQWRYPFPADSVIFRMSRVVIHIDGPSLVRLDMAPDQHRSTISDHVATRNGDWLDVEWSQDSSQLAFVSSSRDNKSAQLSVADPETGDVRHVMGETVDTFFESGNGKVNWHVLKESGEVIWFSQRDDWGHLYLYDLFSGNLKHQITKGTWNVQQLLRIDREQRILYFVAAGGENGDPYYRNLYSIKMDGSGLKRLTPEPENHVVTFSPSGTHFVDSYSTPFVPPVTVLRDLEGQKVLTLEEADISELTAAGWIPPVPFITKARDGSTDLYGLMYKPSHFDASKRYPVLNYLYPGPQSGSVGSRSFRASRSDKQALAELGFIVVEVDAMGTPGRSKTFHEAYYGNMGDNGLPDQIATIKELAARFSWMDIDRVGIWGHSGGGFASTGGILRYPDFYKVAVSGAGNHDNRNYEDDWGEKWQGLLVNNEDGTSNYDNQANQLLAGNLKGKLLIAHGTMDSNVPPSNTLLLVDALIEANKDFELIMFPNRGHGFGNEPYMMRRRWDFFVRHLLGAEPPKEFDFKPPGPRS